MFCETRGFTSLLPHTAVKTQVLLSASGTIKDQATVSTTSPSPKDYSLPFCWGVPHFFLPYSFSLQCYSINILSVGLFKVGSHNLGADKRSVTNSRDKERFDVHFKNKTKKNRKKAKQIKAGKTTKTFKQCKWSQIVTSYLSHIAIQVNLIPEIEIRTKATWR